MAFTFAAMLGEELANHEKELVYFPLAEAAHLPVYDRSSSHPYYTERTHDKTRRPHS
jgi:hypothetical protein